MNYRHTSGDPRKQLAAILASAGLLLLSGCVSEAAGQDKQEPATMDEGGAQHDKKPDRNKLRFDVAENMTRFVFDDAPTFEDGMPAYGNPFVTQGYIYPYGFLDDHAGTTEDGEPSHPEKVLGEWTCRGVMIGNGARTESGPWVMTTQHYDFYDEPGYAPNKRSSRANLVTEGYEVPDVGEPVMRAITGGTGAYAKARGEATQWMLGFAEDQSVRLRFEIPVKARH